MFRALNNLYEHFLKTGKCPGYGMTYRDVQFGVVINANGELIGIEPFISGSATSGNEEGSGRRLAVPIIPTDRTGNSISPSFLFDCKPDYFFGVQADKGKAGVYKLTEKSRKSFLAERDYVETILKNTNTKSAEALKSFFRSWNPEGFFGSEILKPYMKQMWKGRLTFMLSEEEDEMDIPQFLTEDHELISAYQKIWVLPDDGSRKAYSLVSGEYVDTAMKHYKINLPQCDGLGCSLVSFNDAGTQNETLKENRSSYLEQGLNAPMSKKEAFAYVEALNAMYSDPLYHKNLGEGNVLYQWTESGVPALTQCEEQEMLKDVMSALVDGKPYRIENAVFEPDTVFYTLLIRSNVKRASIVSFTKNSYRDYAVKWKKYAEETSLGDCGIVNPYGIVCSAAVSKKEKQEDGEIVWKEVVTEAVKAQRVRDNQNLRSAMLSGRNYPEDLKQKILERCLKDGRISHARVSFLKAWLMRNANIALKPKVDENVCSQAYTMGRLFRVMEEIQARAKELAGTSLHEGIKEKYFTPAIQNPKPIFEILKENCEHYKKFFFKEKKYLNLVSSLSYLQKKSGMIPERLDDKEKAAFVVGYYQQHLELTGNGRANDGTEEFLEKEIAA